MNRTSTHLIPALALVCALAATATVQAAASSAGAVDGVYRFAWTQNELMARGTTQRYARSSCPQLPCVLTTTLRDGTLLVHSPPLGDCHGTYTTSGNTLSMTFRTHCHGIVTGRWSLMRRELRLHVTRVTDRGDEVLWGVKPWKKIG